MTIQHNAVWTLDLSEVNRASLPLVGGKGANLGELLAAGFPVPSGFCVTTAAFERFIAAQPAMQQHYAMLAALDSQDLDGVRVAGAALRATLVATPMPQEIEQAIVERWRTHGENAAYGVRSSATAEDLPQASFAGQQDTYLNVRGEAALLTAVRDCWASLFTDRAILYRAQQGFDHRDVRLSVVVQGMVQAEIAGIMFTADPVSGNRNVVSIDASYGLGEALVSGIVSADLYQVDARERRIVKRQIADKQVMVRSLPAGGVEQVALEGAARTAPVLDDAQVLALSDMGRRIAAHYGTPQDIEWALVDAQWSILQARPITSLYPLPQPAPRDETLHIYFSFSHFQVMTDPMPPLAASIWRMLVPFNKPKGSLETETITVAGGRLYADVSPAARHPVLGKTVPRAMSNADRLAGLALEQVVEREAFRRGPVLRFRTITPVFGPLLGRALVQVLWKRYDGEAERGVRLMDRYVANANAMLQATPAGEARLRAAVALLNDFLLFVVRNWFATVIAGLLTSSIAQRLARGVASDADVTAMGRGLPNNVTTEMDLAVGDLADIVRQAPVLRTYLQNTDVAANERIIQAANVEGGPAFVAAWQGFIDRYGARAPSEIDLSRPRWAEQPSSLLQMVLNAASHDEVGTHRRHYARLIAEGDAAARRVVRAAWRGPFGFVRGPLVGRLLRMSRTLGGTREMHKFWLVRVLALVKVVFNDAGTTLAMRGCIAAPADVWFLTVPEVLAAMQGPDKDLTACIAERRAAFARAWDLTPPRIITSEGEIPAVTYPGDIPHGALAGSPVSAGVVEGIARVIRDPQTERLHVGEILVAPFTDPGWTPLFINAAGLVMEVGGLMTHGSVIAREYGIPAVVGVVGATTRIKSGQRVRVNGTAGYVEIIDDQSATDGEATAAE